MPGYKLLFILYLGFAGTCGSLHCYLSPNVEKNWAIVSSNISCTYSLFILWYSNSFYVRKFDIFFHVTGSFFNFNFCYFFTLYFKLHKLYSAFLNSQSIILLYFLWLEPANEFFISHVVVFNSRIIICFFHKNFISLLKLFQHLHLNYWTIWHI